MSVNNVNSVNSLSVAQLPPSLMVFFLSENRNSLATPFELFVGSSLFFQWFFFLSTEFMLQLPCATTSFIIDCCHQLLTHLLHSFKIGFIIVWSTYSGGYSVQVLEMRPQTESFHEWQERWTVKRVFRWMSLPDCECLQADFASCACQSCNGHKECTRSPPTVKLSKIALINLIIVWQCTKNASCVE